MLFLVQSYCFLLLLKTDKDKKQTEILKSQQRSHKNEDKAQLQKAAHSRDKAIEGLQQQSK